jgi:hypothetical protein
MMSWPEPSNDEEDLVGDIPRKQFDNRKDEEAARRLEAYIVRQRNGAGSWPDGVNLPIGDIIAGSTMRIIDKVATNHDGFDRHVELHQDGRLIVTLVYNHYTRQLVRTF